MSWPTVTVGAGNSGVDLANGNTVSWSHTVTSGQTLLEVLIGEGNVGGVHQLSGVTWNGTAMTLKAQQSDALWANSSVYELVDPTPGTGNVVITEGAGNLDDIAGVSISFDGASTTTGAISHRTTTDEASPTLTVVDSADGDIVLSWWMTDDATSGSPSVGGTLLRQDLALDSDNDYMAQRQTATGANTVCSWTHSVGQGATGKLMGFAVKQAAGGGGPTPLATMGIGIWATQ